MLIAQVTDTHFGGRGETLWHGYSPRAATDAVVARVNAAAPDLVLFTGDLTERPTEEAYEEAGAALGRLAAPLAAIPGNHDERALFRRTIRRLGGAVGAPPFLQLDLEAGPVRLLCLDTVEPALAPGGRLCRTRLRWIDDRLAERPDAPTLVALHHPPFPVGIPGMDAIGCAGGELLGAILGRHRQVRCVLSGHVHRAIQADWAGRQASVAPAVAWEIDLAFRTGDRSPHRRSPPAFHLHRIDAAGAVLTQTVVVA